MASLKTTKAIVIGAGIGGLASAALLAARGIDVRVFERAPASGGKLRTHGVGGFEIDAGPTVFTMRWVFDELFAEAGACLDDVLTLTPARILARHAWTDGLDVGTTGSSCRIRGRSRCDRALRRASRTHAATANSAPVPVRSMTPSKSHSFGPAARAFRVCCGEVGSRDCPDCCASHRSRRYGRNWHVTSPIRGCASCSVDTRPIAVHRPGWRRPR